MSILGSQLQTSSRVDFSIDRLLTRCANNQLDHIGHRPTSLHTDNLLQISPNGHHINGQIAGQQPHPNKNPTSEKSNIRQKIISKKCKQTLTSEHHGSNLVSNSENCSLRNYSQLYKEAVSSSYNNITSNNITSSGGDGERNSSDSSAAADVIRGLMGNRQLLQQVIWGVSFLANSTGSYFCIISNATGFKVISNADLKRLVIAATISYQFCEENGLSSRQKVFIMSENIQLIKNLQTVLKLTKGQALLRSTFEILNSDWLIRTFC